MTALLAKYAPSPRSTASYFGFRSLFNFLIDIVAIDDIAFLISNNIRQQIVGVTDVTFRTTPEDRNILYLATDGGELTGGPATRGQIVALDPYN